MTPATKSPAHKPLERCLTKAGATDSGSYFALQPSGGQYLLPQPRYAVAPGQRFAFRLTIIDADGLRGRSFMTDLIREDYAAPSVALVANQYPDREGGNQATLLGEHVSLLQFSAQPQMKRMSYESIRTDKLENQSADESGTSCIYDANRMMRGRSPASP